MNSVYKPSEPLPAQVHSRKQS